jgi:hypothetical protein
MAEQRPRPPAFQGHFQGEIEFEPTGHVPPFGPYLTSRARARRLGVTLAAVLLAVVGIFVSFPAVRAGIASRQAQPTPTVPAAQLPGEQFYFQPNVPWDTVLVDGKLLTHVPQAREQDQPLRLAPGTHTLQWLAPPFQPQRCQLTVPTPITAVSPSSPAPSTREPCPLLPWQSASGASAGYIIDVRDSLAALDPARQRALRVAIQAGLDAATSTLPLAPGEYYAVPGGGGAPSYVAMRATRPLQATLSFTLASGWSEPCTLSPAIACQFPAQDCQQICTLTSEQVPPVLPPRWLVAVPVTQSWTYRAADGHVLQRVPGSLTLNYFLAVLTITWDGANWSATPSFGHAAGGDVGDSAACDLARADLLTNHDSALGPVQFQLDLQTQRFRAGANPAAGCAVTASTATFGGTPVAGGGAAIFLHRFGVLLAANDVAARIAPGLPRATADERSTAAMLLTEH